MRNIVILLIFVIAVNVVISTVIEFNNDTTNSDVQQKIDANLLDAENQLYDIRENQLVDATQRDVTTDLLPPVDVNPSSSNILKYLWGGITYNFRDLSVTYSNPIEIVIIKWIQWIMRLVNITCILWGVIYIYAKVVHT